MWRGCVDAMWHVAWNSSFFLLLLDFALSEFGRFAVGSAGVAVRLETLMSR